MILFSFLACSGESANKYAELGSRLTAESKPILPISFEHKRSKVLDNVCMSMELGPVLGMNHTKMRSISSGGRSHFGISGWRKSWHPFCAAFRTVFRETRTLFRVTSFYLFQSSHGCLWQSPIFVGRPLCLREATIEIDQRRPWDRFRPKVATNYEVSLAGKLQGRFFPLSPFHLSCH